MQMNFVILQDMEGFARHRSRVVGGLGVYVQQQSFSLRQNQERFKQILKESKEV